MDLRKLSSFLAVAEEGHFGRAAARLFLSPSALTGHVQQLERELGTTLLHRTPVRLTPAGQRLLRHARLLLDAANEAIDDVADAAATPPAGADRPLRIGIMAHGSAEITPTTIRAFRRVRPAVRVSIETLDFTEHLSPLLEDRVDVAFVRPAPEDDRVVADVLTTERRIVVVPDTWEIAHAPEAQLADVLNLPYFRVPPSAPRAFTDYLYFTEARGGEEPRRSRDYACTPHEVLNGVAAGRGAGSALASFARYYPWPGTTCVPIVDAPWQDSVLVSRADDESSDVRLFRALAVALAQERATTGAGHS
ncbi:LysR substrate-binding domain-containing protein [Streptomyces sp. CA-132043]|uniref:LysR substrate-binding domain-containing protein n=1 Tax=Streptomyces sp. CA-132043 TaxID=3240048 RepID=UPI003D916607